MPFFWNVYHSFRYGEPAPADDPWGSAPAAGSGPADDEPPF